MASVADHFEHLKPYLENLNIDEIPRKLPKGFTEGKDSYTKDMDDVHQFGENSYKNNSNIFMLRVKSLRPYWGKRLKFREMCDLLSKESEHQNQQVFEGFYTKGEKNYHNISMKDMCDQMRTKFKNSPNEINLYLKSGSGTILFVYDPKIKQKAPDAASAASPFRPRRRSKSAKKRRNLKSKSKSKSKKRSSKPRRR
jgi:hypothetical protein